MRGLSVFACGVTCSCVLVGGLFFNIGLAVTALILACRSI